MFAFTHLLFLFLLNNVLLFVCFMYVHTHMCTSHISACWVVSNFLWPHGLYSLPDSSVHGIFQARILEWVTVFYSRGSPWPRDLTHVSCISCIGRWIPYHYATWEALTSHTCTSNWSPPKQRCPFCMLRVLATRDYKGLRWWLPLPSIWELRSLNLSLWNGLHNFSLSERLLISPFELAEQFTSIIPLGSELHRLILHYVKITFLWSKHCHSFIWWDKVNHITPLVF